MEKAVEITWQERIPETAERRDAKHAYDLKALKLSWTDLVERIHAEKFSFEN